MSVPTVSSIDVPGALAIRVVFVCETLGACNGHEDHEKSGSDCRSVTSGGPYSVGGLRSASDPGMVAMVDPTVVDGEYTGGPTRFGTFPTCN